jgi:hypothetical protein
MRRCCSRAHRHRRRAWRWRQTCRGRRPAFAGLRAASRAMPTLLRRIEKSEIDEAEIEAFHHRADCACCLAQSNRLIASFEGNVGDGFWRKRVLAAASSTTHRSEKPYIFGNKARAGRVSCLAAQIRRHLLPSTHRESETWPKKAWTIMDTEWVVERRPGYLSAAP